MNCRENRPWASRTVKTAGLAFGLALLAVAGRAVADPPPHHGPPPQAFTACDGKAHGDACSVSFHGTDVSGTCDAPPGESRLACRPDHPPPPPPEAFAACDGKASGDACSVSFHGNAVSGTCGAPPGESRLSCMPRDMPPPPDH